MKTLKQAATESGLTEEQIQEAYTAEEIYWNMPQYLKIESVMKGAKCDEETARKAMRYVWDNIFVEI